MRVPIIAFLFCVAGFIADQPVLAQTDKQVARTQEQVHRLRQQLQQIQQAQQTQAEQAEKEKSDMDTQLKRTGGELSAVRRKVAESAKRASEAEAQVQSLQQERDALTAKLAESDKQLASTKQLLSDTASKLKTRDGEARQLQTRLGTEQSEHTRCEANNVALYQYGRELMNLYQHKGVWSAVIQAEPLTGLERVKIENLLEEYRDKLDKQKLEPSASETNAQ